MNNSINVNMIVFFLGAAQGTFLALLLFNKHGNKTANRFLAVLMLSYSAFIIQVVYLGTDIFLRFPHFIGISEGIVFVFGPLHYLYARYLIFPDERFTKKQWLHFLPVATFFLTFLFPFFLKSGEFKIKFIQQFEPTDLPLVIMVFGWVKILLGIIYMVVTLALLHRYSRRIRDSYSSLEKISLDWLRYITLMTAIVWILVFIINFAELIGYTSLNRTAIPFTTAILVYVMGYIGLRQPEIFSGIIETKEQKKYARSGLSQEKAHVLLNKLIHLMESEKPFTDSNLKLNQLAQMLSTTPNYLSQVINEKLNQNFFDFVNSYRIEEAKRMMTDSSIQNFTLLSIAYDVGFNSKSAFNTSFKKHTHLTPSQFKNNSL